MAAKASLEMALKDIEDKSIKLIDEKLVVERKLKAANLEISAIQGALDHKEKQLKTVVIVRAGERAADKYKPK